MSQGSRISQGEIHRLTPLGLGQKAQPNPPMENRHNKPILARTQSLLSREEHIHTLFFCRIETAHNDVTVTT